MTARTGAALLAALLAGLLVLGACGDDDAAPATEQEGSAAPTASAAPTDPTAPTDTEAATDTESATDPEAATDTESATDPSEQRFPDVIAATAEMSGDTWSLTATVSSPYDTPERYADAWRVLTPEGDVLGVRELAHDHAAEQPFTRSLNGVEIPASVDRVTIEGRDLVNGWGGATVTIDLERP